MGRHSRRESKAASKAVLGVKVVLIVAIGLVVLLLLHTLQRSWSPSSEVKAKQLSTDYAPALRPLVRTPQWFKSLVSLSNQDEFMHTAQAFLNLGVRSVGEVGHKAAREFIVDFLSNLGWKIDLDSFEDRTPFGMKNFTNVIARESSGPGKYLTLACHYDSKYFAPPAAFLGATDSALPCMILLDIARALQPRLQARHSAGPESGSSVSGLQLQYIFFDGEEAFAEWTDTDSLYGARHLAAKWEAEGTLTSISTLVLLDLLGAASPNLQSHFDNTDDLHRKLVTLESSLRRENMIPPTLAPLFNPSRALGPILDDHIPFLQRSVPVLHVISAPFPPVWHTLRDNYSALDPATCHTLNMVFRLFVAELLQL